MRKLTLIGLIACTFISMSAPAFAQPQVTTAQPVLKAAQAQTDITIAQGTVQEFDAAKGEIKIDGVLTNKGTIIIRSSNPTQKEALLRAGKIINEGKIVSEVPTLTINAESVVGSGEVTAPESIAIANPTDLNVIGGTYRAKWFRPSSDGKVAVHAQRIDAKIDLQANGLNIGVAEGNLDIVKQKLDGDPIYYNTGGDISAVMPSMGDDIYVLASGNVTLSAVDTTGGPSGEAGRLVANAGLHFARPGGNGVIGCGLFGQSCFNTIQTFSQPGQILEPAQGTFPPSGTITITGAKAKVISLTARDIVVNGTIQAVQDTKPAGPAITLTAANSITGAGRLQTDQTAVEPNYGIVDLESPNISLSGKITSDIVTVNGFQTSESANGVLKTGAIDARVYIIFNGGQIIYGGGGGGGGAAAAPLPASSFGPGDFSIKTGKLTAGRYVMLGATGNIDTGAIEILENHENTPFGGHDVRIHANVGKANAPVMNVGGGTNGPASITVNGTIDYAPGLDKNVGAVFLSNGPSGDITLNGGNIHLLSNTHGTPSLLVNAGTGKITLKGGLIAVDGNATVPAGSIELIADEIRSTGATLSASDTVSTPADIPAQIILATSKIPLAGDLTVQANGNKLTGVTVVPAGSLVDDPLSHFQAETIRVRPGNISPTEQQVLVSGAGNLVLQAQSDTATVTLSGKPFKFNNAGTSDVKALGKQTQISVSFAGAPTGVNSLEFGGGKVNFYADAQNSDGGTISINADGVKTQAGADLGLFARALSTGNGGTITVNAAKVKLGASNNTVDVSSEGAAGNGGNVTISTTSTASLDLSNAIIEANSGSTGDGGNISITGNDIVITGIQITANAFDTGTGGEIDLVLNGAHKVLDLSQAFALHAIGGENGFGGTLSVTDFVAMDDPNNNFDVYAEPQAIPAFAPTVNPHAGPTGTGGVIKNTRKGITCQFYKTPAGTTWPKGYWNCAHPGGATAEDQAAVNVALGLSAADRNTLMPVSIYVFKNVTDFQNYMNRKVKDPAEAGHE